MKKIMSKVIAVILVMCMILPIIPAWAFAVELVQSEGNAEVTFKLEKVSETKNDVTVKVVLAEGKALCFDAQADASDYLSCVSITFSEDIKNFCNENSDGFVTSNIENGKFSFINVTEISAPMDIAEITYSKTSSNGITLHDIGLNIDSCYYTGENGEDVEANVVVVNEIPAEHTHVASGVWVEVSPATCQHGGQKVMYCTECDMIAEVEYTAQSEHVTKTVTVQPTCEKDGYVAEVCTLCGEEISKTILPKSGHKAVVNQHKDATCTEDGYDRTYCNDCKKVISETVIKAPGHKIVVDEKAATCTENGYHKETCTVCKEVIKNEVIKATGHQHTVNQHKDATCTENGYDRVYCNDCKKVISEKILPATNHANTEKQHKDATCTENGYDRIYCKDCKKVISETVIKATGHKIVVDKKAATCTVDGYYKETCSVCKTVIKNEVIKATGHQHKKTETLAATCTVNGYIKEICTDCGTVVKETVLKAAGHKYVKDVKQATCTENGYMRYQCSVCKHLSSNIVLKAPGHSWGAWKVVKEATYRSEGLKRSTCTTCGTYKDEVIPMIVVPVQKIVIVPEEDFKIHCKKTDRLQATVYPEEAAYTADIVWKSSNPNVVSVSEDGTITTKLKGTATITASTKDGKVSATRNITVEYSLLQWVIVYILFGWIWYL